MKKTITLLLIICSSLVNALPNDSAELKKLQASADEIHRKFIANGGKPAPEETTSWVQARESGYVNCLLTILAEGHKESVTLTNGQNLPNLAVLANGNPGLFEWAKKLDFPYQELSTEKVITILLNSFEIQKTTKGSLKTILVKQDGSPLAVLFTAEKLSSKNIKISVLRAL